jgi:hypothetical protein
MTFHKTTFYEDRVLMNLYYATMDIEFNDGQIMFFDVKIPANNIVEAVGSIYECILIVHENVKSYEIKGIRLDGIVYLNTEYSE